jgi:hypothetical protein
MRRAETCRRFTTYTVFIVQLLVYMYGEFFEILWFLDIEYKRLRSRNFTDVPKWF